MIPATPPHAPDHGEDPAVTPEGATMPSPSFPDYFKNLNPYFHLTEQFNEHGFNAILTSGQACVYYRIAFQSKDGDWIVRLDRTAMDQVLTVLEGVGSTFRRGSAPLDPQWHAGGWSSHLEHLAAGVRIRTDLLGRPPRITPDRLAALWAEAGSYEAPVTRLPDLIAMKRTQRDKDWPIIGSLADRLEDPQDQLLNSIAPLRLTQLVEHHQDLAARLAGQRPLLRLVGTTSERQLREALMMERLDAMDADRERIQRFAQAMDPWMRMWPEWESKLGSLPAREANHFLIEQAHDLLPTHP